MRIYLHTAQLRACEEGVLVGKQLIDAGAQKKKTNISCRPLKDASRVWAFVALRANHQISWTQGDLFCINFIISKIYCFPSVPFER